MRYYKREVHGATTPGTTLHRIYAFNASGDFTDDGGHHSYANPEGSRFWTEATQQAYEAQQMKEKMLEGNDFGSALDDGVEKQFYGESIASKNAVLQRMVDLRSMQLDEDSTKGYAGLDINFAVIDELTNEESTEMKIETGVTMITDGSSTKRASMYSDDDLIRLIAAEKEKYATLLETAEGTKSKALAKRLLIHMENVDLLVAELDGRMDDETIDTTSTARFGD